MYFALSIPQKRGDVSILHSSIIYFLFSIFPLLLGYTQDMLSSYK